MSKLLTMTPEQFCDATNACSDGREYALTQPTMADAWDNCPRADWLLWIVNRLNEKPDDRTLRLFAIWCARNTPLADGQTTVHLLTDPRSLAALEVAERYAYGKSSRKELAAAEDAAEDAAWSAGFAAGSAARSAAWSAAWSAARSAVDAAAWSAGSAARSAVDAAADAAGASAEKAQANQLRTMVPNPFKEAKP